MRLKFIFVATLLAAMTPLAGQAQDYPDRPVQFIIPFGAGGGNDIVGRFVATQLSELWGQPVVVENKTGAGGVVGSLHVARAAPDGYTIMFISSSYTTNAASRDNMNFDPIADLTPVAMAGTTDMLLTIANHIEASNVKELVEVAKSQDVFWASAGGGGGIIEFASRLLIDTLDVEMVRVPYQGAPEALTDMMGARVDIYHGPLPVLLPQVKSGAIKAIALAGPQRSKSLPDVATLSEQGIDGADVESWWAVFVPSATPQEIKDRLNNDINQIMSTPEAAEFLERSEARPLIVSIEEATAMVASEIDKWTEIAQKHGIKAD